MQLLLATPFIGRSGRKGKESPRKGLTGSHGNTRAHSKGITRTEETPTGPSPGDPKTTQSDPNGPSPSAGTDLLVTMLIED
ncbi:hypothetical protein LIER_19384 [Lithospermum erythrorhizon]|uniref:Uncharacterized protein n=1 Tax=Lithospermum erythrorhizon TaxID=34254 RepID=A0AAV3QJV2_LITER